ncbi:MAG: hypothetical protein WKG01_11130 [Kofleriaceae bacterium]
MGREVKTAAEVGRSPKIDPAPDMAPGKQTLVQGQSGIDALDHGSVCDGRTADSECAYSADQRNLLIGLVNGRVRRCEMNIMLALTEVQITSMIEQDEDLGWLATLVLDLVGAHLISKVMSGFLAMRAGGAFGSVVQELKPSLRSDAWVTRMSSLIQKVSDEDVKYGVKFAVENRKKAISSALQTSKDGGDLSTKKEGTASYINFLRNETNQTFEELEQTVAARLTDAELVALFHSLATKYHSVNVYVEVFKDKLKQFRQSGVPMIGTKRLTGNKDWNTRVIWVNYASGHPRELRFQTWEAWRASEATKTVPTKTFEPVDNGPSGGAVPGGPQLGPTVDEEFVGVAIASHMTRWNAAVPSMEIDESVQGDWWARDPVRATKAKMAKSRDKRLMGNADKPHGPERLPIVHDDGAPPIPSKEPLSLPAPPEPIVKVQS